jgi:hypothetical protein
VAVARLTVSKWQGNRVSERVVNGPSLPQVEAALRRLDNRAFNDLYLQPNAADSETYLCVGGAAGRYSCLTRVGTDEALLNSSLRSQIMRVRGDLMR